MGAYNHTPFKIQIEITLLKKQCFFKKNISLFGRATSSLQHAACELLVSAWSHMWNLVLWPGIEPWPSALGVQSLSQWTTREVP